MKTKRRKVTPAVEKCAKFAKTLFGVPKTEGEAEDAKWHREHARCGGPLNNPRRPDSVPRSRHDFHGAVCSATSWPTSRL